MEWDIAQALATIATKSRYYRLGFVKQLVSAYEDYQYSPRAGRYYREAIRIARAYPKMIAGSYYARQVLDRDMELARQRHITKGAYLRMVREMYVNCAMQKDLAWEGFVNTLPKLYKN